MPLTSSMRDLEFVQGGRAECPVNRHGRVEEFMAELVQLSGIGVR